MKLNIAICDDDILQVELTKELILSVELTQDITFIQAYTGRDLLEQIGKQKIDIIILDIEMEGLDGIETARQIREKDQEIIIVFITGFERYALQAYDLDVFSYVTKPISKKKILKLMMAIIKYLDKIEAYNEKNRYISFKNNGQVYQINYNDIYYFDKILRKIIVYGKDGNFEFYGSIKNLKDKLDDGCFIQIHQGALVNKKMIKKYKDGEIILNGFNNTLPVSRRYKHDVINTLSENLF